MLPGMAGKDPLKHFTDTGIPASAKSSQPPGMTLPLDAVVPAAELDVVDVAIEALVDAPPPEPAAPPPLTEPPHAASNAIVASASVSRVASMSQHVAPSPR